MLGVDLRVPEGIPKTLLYTSDQGMVNIAGLEVIKVSRAFIRVSNAVGLYREAGKIPGSTYAGGPIIVTGQITRAMLNFAEHRLALGADVDKVDVKGNKIIRPRVITSSELTDLIGGEETPKLANWPARSPNKNFYPIRANIDIIVNKDMMNVLPIGVVDGSAGLLALANDPQDNTGLGYHMTFTAFNALISNFVIAFDSRGIITSGPINFMGSAGGWRIDQIPAV